VSLRAYALIAVALAILAWATSPARANAGGIGYCAGHKLISAKLQ